MKSGYSAKLFFASGTNARSSGDSGAAESIPAAAQEASSPGAWRSRTTHTPIFGGEPMGERQPDDSAANNDYVGGSHADILAGIAERLDAVRAAGSIVSNRRVGFRKCRPARRTIPAPSAPSFARASNRRLASLLSLDPQSFEFSQPCPFAWRQDCAWRLAEDCVPPC